MRNTIYRQIVYYIDAHRTWIEVADDKLYKEYVVSRNDRTDYLVSRTLVLRAIKTDGAYSKGMSWTIPEYELDKALADYRKRNCTFKFRLQKRASCLTAEDVENIIRLATYGIIHLKLAAQPIYTASTLYRI